MKNNQWFSDLVQEWYRCAPHIAALLRMEECAAAALPCPPMASMSESPKAAVAAARLSWRGSPGSLSFPLALSTT